MWTVTARLFSEQLRLPIMQENGVLPSSQRAYEIASASRRELSRTVGVDRLAQYLAAEARSQESESVARPPVQELFRENESAITETLFRDEPILSSLRQTRHAPTLFVAPLRGDEQDLGFEFQLQSLPLEWRSAKGPSYYALDWRAYLGTGTAILDGRTRPIKVWPNWKRLRFRLQGLPHLPCLLVGYLLQFTGTNLDLRLRYDPTFPGRCARMEAEYSTLTQQFPDLRSSLPVSQPSAAVFVHGAHSHCLESLKDLAPFSHNVNALFRFEHDTFVSLAESGTELFDLIDQKIQTNFLTLIAHSRGGLVARFARQKLKLKGYTPRVRIITCGTPHRGTPLVNCLEGNASLVFRLGRLGFMGLPALSGLEYALSCLLNVQVVPAGIACMEDGSEALSTLNGLDDPAGIECWGAKFDPGRAEGGYGVFVNGVLEGTLSGIDNDLVVPTESARSFGTAQPALGCAHSGYFHQSAVRTNIQLACPGLLY